MNQENERLSLELEERKRQIEEMSGKSQSLEAELKGLRDQEAANNLLFGGVLL